MKYNFALCSLLFALCATGVNASDCLWDDCYIDAPAPAVKYEKPEPLPIAFEPAPDYTSIKAISIKPVETDGRKPLWDGTHSAPEPAKIKKTTDNRGTPLWDDSISHYNDRDYRDWLLEPAPVVFVGGQTPQITDEVIATRKRVEDLLQPARPRTNLWIDEEIQVPVHMTKPMLNIFDIEELVTVAIDDGCPFETTTECDIWRKKPMVRETVSPRAPKLRAAKMDEFINAATVNKDISASDATAAPLLERYKILMQSANACCTDGMTHQLKTAGADDALIYKFLADDANFYQIGSRCLMTTDAQLDEKFPNTAFAAVAADVRNGCLCRSREWFTAMLSPFQEAYGKVPEFEKSKFNYTYTDGLKREITVSVNHDVQNVLNQLEKCP